ncbi:beta-glucoside-specific PTS transporter subunit IIABC [Gracilibacillus timonensis]|uniref:beta-glucoside-specific PTS transporter subunit IIABC n=1 Tax=Gracilibacillus timonensis TaxID=1816696 RepID=UPI00082569D1|nr:beta-glucoside-specific PTS transporter subunit IIABC [Gracilibacillus timonensis]
MDKQQLAKEIIHHIGGEANVLSLVHCTTRLRFTVKDKHKINKSAIHQLPGVIQTIFIAGQFQLVIGNEVNAIYREIIKQFPIDNTTSQQKRNWFDKAVDTISGIFMPLLSALIGAGILKGLLLLCLNLDLLHEQSGTYQVFHAASDSLFYFLPMLLAFTAARKFDADPIVAVVVAGALLYPELSEIFQEQGDLSFLGIPIIVTNYATSVIPIIIAVYMLAKLEHVLNGWLSPTLQTFVTPLLLIALMVPASILIFGPIGLLLGDHIATGYMVIYENSAILAGILIGFFWQILVIVGLHWGLVPIAFNNLSYFGSDTFTAMLAPAVFSQAGATFGVWLRTKDKKQKRLAGPASFSGLLGVTEPAIYGINLRLKRPFFIGCAAGAVGGGVVGFAGTAAKGASLPGLPALPVFLGEGFGLFLLAIISSFGLATILTFLFSVTKEQTITLDDNNQATEQTTTKLAKIEIASPLNGAVVPLSEVDDAIFSSGAIGEGVAIIPINGVLQSPISGTVTSLFPTHHAIGMTSDEGVQLFIHLGIGTVQLDGTFFSMEVQTGDSVRQGETIGSFDISGITEAGYDMVTPVIITNSDQFMELLITEEENIICEERLMTVIK